MDYTEDDLIDFIARHDEHEGYYREQLARLRAEHDREVAAAALREFRMGFGRRFGFQDPYGSFDSATVSALHRQVEGLLDAEIDRIEKERTSTDTGSQS